MSFALGSSIAPPEPVRVLSAHLLRSAARFTPLPKWMEEHALTAMSPGARQLAWALGRRVTGNPDHGFAIAEPVPAESVGSLWTLYRAAPNLAAVHRLYPRVAALLIDPVQCTIEEGERSVWLGFKQAYRADRAEEDMRAALQIKTWRALLDANVSPLSVHFSYERPRSTATHERVLETRDLRFEQPALRFELARSWWERPLPSANADEFARLSALTIAEAQTFRRAEQQRVEGVLTQLLSTGARTETIANLLGVSARTLHRKLREQGSSFRALLERAQQREHALFAQAEALYGVRMMSSGQRARLLGFANAGALRNALRRWRVRS